MIRPFFLSLMSPVLGGGLALASVGAEAPAEPLVMPQEIEYLLEDYCWKCHDYGSQKGDVRLDNLTELPLGERLDLLNRMHEQSYLEHMPPQDEDDQPSSDERAQLIEWIAGDLRTHGAEKLSAKLRLPAYGNYVDHDKLFSGAHADLKAATPDRRWLISEFIFNEKFNRLLRVGSKRTVAGKTKARRVDVRGSSERRGINLTNPFLLPSGSGVRYYDTTTLDGGHLLTMLTNAREASAHIMELSRKTQGRGFPAIAAIMEAEWQREETLARREEFLTRFIDRVLVEVYEPGEHEALLPQFVPDAVDPAPAAGAKGLKKAPFERLFRDFPREEMEWMDFTVAKFEDRAGSDRELLELCERDWVHFGHSPQKIEVRVKFLRDHLEPWRERLEQRGYGRRNPPPEFEPLDEDEMRVIREALRKHRRKGDTYLEIIRKCMAGWAEESREQRGTADEESLAALVTELHGEILERAPTDAEVRENTRLVKSYIENQGHRAGIRKLIETLILNSDFVYRSEFGTGEPDEFGRRMLSPRDAAYAISYALTDSSPDAELMKAAESGRLATREDYEREVRRLLAKRDEYYIIDEAVERLDVQSFTNLPIRKLRFFREFFGYPKLLPIFKDNKRFGGQYQRVTGGLVSEADLLVEHILKRDRDVIEELLTTDEYYVFHSGDNEAMAAFTESLRGVYDYFRDKDWQEFDGKDFARHTEFLKAHGISGVHGGDVGWLKQTIASVIARFDKGQKGAVPYVIRAFKGPVAKDRSGRSMTHAEIVKCYDLDLHDWDYPVEQPAPMPHRAGILTHPAWLIAFARNTETDPIHRGKWIREKLLAGTIPDVPITVDAVVPEDPSKTLRTRLAEATGGEYCWKCHQLMNPLGTAFEMYDDFGRYRMEEFLEHPDHLVEERSGGGGPHEDGRDIFKALPVVTTGRLDGTGDPELDGDVEDGIELTRRLARSDRVRQSVIRHAFRYFMGRNETLADSRTLIDADRAYLESDGSFDAVIVSLLTSDSFIYRIPPDH